MQLAQARSAHPSSALPYGGIDGVIAEMRRLEATLAPADGLRWFNRMYLQVTERVRDDLRAGRFAVPEWLERLDVLFARYYLVAVESWTAAPARTPRAWRPMFSRRFEPGIARIQFAVAGMNAHINRDLCHAVVETCLDLGVEPRTGSGWHEDYLRVNQVLADVELPVMRQLSGGALARVQAALDHADDRLAVWTIRRLRDVAWTNAQLLWRLRRAAPAEALFARGVDTVTGEIGRRVLVPAAGVLGASPAEARRPIPRVRRAAA